MTLDAHAPRLFQFLRTIEGRGDCFTRLREPEGRGDPATHELRSPGRMNHIFCKQVHNSVFELKTKIKAWIAASPFRLLAKTCKISVYTLSISLVNIIN